MLPLVWFLLADKPEKKGLTPLGDRDPSERTCEGIDDSGPETTGCTLREALGQSTFWCLGLTFCLGSAAAFGVTTHQVAFLQDVGLALEWASTIAGLTLGLTALGRLVIGWASGRTDRPHRMLGGCLVVQAAGVALLLQTHAWGLWTVAGFALLFGLGFGGFLVLYPLGVAHDFGLRAFGAIAGVLGTVGVTLGGALGPVTVGLTYDDTGSYAWAFVLCVGLLLAAAAVAFATSETLRPRIAVEAVAPARAPGPAT
jgi:sugar phosphate permease